MAKIAEGRFIQYKAAELQRLQHADPQEQMLYLALKQRVNFNTGAFGTYNNETITLHEHAVEMYRPAARGWPERNYTEADIVGLLDGLEVLGLLENRRLDGLRLTLTMRHAAKYPPKEKCPPQTAHYAPLPVACALGGPPATMTRLPDAKAAAERAEFEAMIELFGTIEVEAKSAATVLVSPPSASPQHPSMFPLVMITNDSSDTSDGMLITAEQTPDDGHGKSLIDALDELMALGEAQARKPIRDANHLPLQQGILATAVAPATSANAAEELPDETDDDEISAGGGLGETMSDEASLSGAPTFEEWQAMMMSSVSGNLPEPEGWEGHAAARWQWVGEQGAQ